MPSANKLTTPIGVEMDELEGRYAPLGDYTVGFETYKQDVDPAPFFAGPTCTSSCAAPAGR